MVKPSTSATSAKTRGPFSTTSRRTVPENAQTRKIQLNSCSKLSTQAHPAKDQIGMKCGREAKNASKFRLISTPCTKTPVKEHTIIHPINTSSRSLPCLWEARFSLSRKESSNSTGVCRATSWRSGLWAQLLASSSASPFTKPTHLLKASKMSFSPLLWFVRSSRL